MSTSRYASSNNASSSHADTGRPKSIAQLAAIAHHNLWDPSKPLKHWLRTAEKARKVGQSCVDSNNFEGAFVEFARAATIVLERLPAHPEYNVLLNSDQRSNLAMNGQDILDELSKLKPYLVERYEAYIARYGEEGPSQPPSEDAARRRREEMAAQAEEEERVRQALEAAHIEGEWRRSDLARREAEDLQRRVQEERDWTRQAKEARLRDTSEAQRAAEAREAAEQERVSHRYRTGEEARRTDERRRIEQEGILQRQHEAEVAARETRRQIVGSSSLSSVLAPSRPPNDPYLRRSQEPETPTHTIPVATPQPSRPPSSLQQQTANHYSSGPPTMPMESPVPYGDDTDSENRNAPWNRPRQADPSPNKPKQLNSGIIYPPPMTTTSPAPPEMGPVRYPTLMSQHQLKQGYFPSLQSMFSHPSNEPPPESAALLLETKPAGPLYNNLLPKPTTSASPVVPPFVPGMPIPDRFQHPYDQRAQRGPIPSSSRPPVPPPPPAQPVPPPAPAPARIVRGASTETEVQDLKSVRLPRDCLPRFLSIARVNTAKNKETCGLLLGKDKGSKYVVTTLLIPKQHSTSDTCTMDEEELVLQFTEERHLITLGWIHTHPTQSCFMSSVDLHTHSGFQRMLPESFAVVCAPTSKPTFGIFRLTDPGGLQVVLDCQAKEAFHPHPDIPIYTDCDNFHVQMKDAPLEIVDLRES